MAGLQKNKLKVWAFQKAVSFANWLAFMPDRMTPPPFRLIQIGSAFWLSRALYVATKLGIADAIGGSEKSVSELAARLALHEDHLYRLLRMLAANGIFQETRSKIFRHSTLSRYLRSDHPKSVRAMILMHNSEVMSRPWFESLEQSIRDGSVPFKNIHGSELFEYMNQYSEFDELFSRAMDTVENLTGLAYLNDFDWTVFNRLVDVGGSQGSKSIAILKRHPQLKAVVYDRPQVVEAARNYWESRGEKEILQRMEFSGGDMLEDIPPAMNEKDVFLLVAILHGMGVDDALKVLSNLSKAVAASNATVVIVDTIVNAHNIDVTVAGMDMQMLMGTKGRERTLTEWQELFAQSDFELAEIVNVSTFAKFMVLKKKSS